MQKNKKNKTQKKLAPVQKTLWFICSFSHVVRWGLGCVGDQGDQGKCLFCFVICTCEKQGVLFA